MSLSSVVSWYRQQSWKNVAGTSLALLMLTAVPASALVLNGTWSIVNRQSGGAPRAIITGDGADENPLTVDMGDTRLVANPSRTMTSVVVARRTFRVEPLSGTGRNAGEQIEFARSFSTDVNGGTVVVSSTIIPPRGLRISPFVGTSRASRSFGENKAVNRFLKAGNYTLLVTITYVKRKGGFWDNSTSGSPHSFSLASI